MHPYEEQVQSYDSRPEPTEPDVALREALVGRLRESEEACAYHERELVRHQSIVRACHGGLEGLDRDKCVQADAPGRY